MQPVEKVARLGRNLHIASIFCLVAVPLGTIGYLVFAGQSAEETARVFAPLSVSPDITNSQLIAAFAVTLLPTLVFVWIMNQMRLLFGHYAKGRILTDMAARTIQKIGLGFVALALAPLIAQPILSVLLSWANPAGQRQLSVGVDLSILGFLITAGMIIVIGWAMREAVQVADENKSFV